MLVCDYYNLVKFLHEYLCACHLLYRNVMLCNQRPRAKCRQFLTLLCFKICWTYFVVAMQYILCTYCFNSWTFRYNATCRDRVIQVCWFSCWFFIYIRSVLFLRFGSEIMFCFQQLQLHVGILDKFLCISLCVYKVIKVLAVTQSMDIASMTVCLFMKIVIIGRSQSDRNIQTREVKLKSTTAFFRACACVRSWRQLLQ